MKKIILIFIFLFISINIFAFDPRFGYFTYELRNDSNNQLYNGTFTVTSGLYNVSVNGTPLFSQKNTSFNITDGTYGKILRSITGVTWSSNLWLGINISGDDIASRMEIVPVPQSMYSLNANNSDNLDGYDSSDFYLSTNPSGFFNNESNITCTSIPGLSAGLCDGTDDTGSDTTCNGQTCAVTNTGTLDGYEGAELLDDSNRTDSEIFNIANNGSIIVDCQTQINFSGTIGSAGICDGTDNSGGSGNSTADVRNAINNTGDYNINLSGHSVNGIITVNDQAHFGGSNCEYDDGNGDVCVSDELEVEGTSRFQNIIFMDVSDIDNENNALRFGSGTKSFVFSTFNNGQNFDHGVQTYPTIFVHAVNPNDYNNRWISLSHNNVSGIINSGYGGVTIDNDLIVSNNITGELNCSNIRFGNGLGSGDICDGVDSGSADTDTNESSRFDLLAGTDCSGTDKVVGVNTTGGVLCSAVAAATNTHWSLNATVLQNESGSLGINKTFFDGVYLDDTDTNTFNSTDDVRNAINKTNNILILNISTARIDYPDVDVSITPGTSTWLSLIGNGDAIGTSANRNLVLYNLLSRNLIELSGQAKLIFGYTDTDKFVRYNSTIDAIEFHVDSPAHYRFWDSDVVVENSVNASAFYVNGVLLQDTQLSEDQVEAYIFDTDNTANLGMGNYNITAIQCLTFNSGGQICSGS